MVNQRSKTSTFTTSNLKPQTSTFFTFCARCLKNLQRKEEDRDLGLIRHKHNRIPTVLPKIFSRVWFISSNVWFVVKQSFFQTGQSAALDIAARLSQKLGLPSEEPTVGSKRPWGPNLGILCFVLFFVFLFFFSIVFLVLSAQQVIFRSKKKWLYPKTSILKSILLA